MAYQEIEYSVSDQVATVRLNRPNKLNAWTRTMASEVRSAMEEAERDDQTRVIVLTGAGRAFCAGADMQLLSQAAGSFFGDVDLVTIKQELFSAPERPGARPDFQKTYSYFPAIEKPIIAAIHGPAVGLGMVLPLFCDIRLASEQAKFSTVFPRRGLIAEYGLAWMLPRVVGMGHAMDLLLTGRQIDAAEARAMGLVQRVFPTETFVEEAQKYAVELARLSSPRSTRIIKRQAYDSLFLSLADSIEQANEEMVQAFFSADFQEGVAHYLEKRPPRFTGA